MKSHEELLSKIVDTCGHVILKGIRHKYKNITEELERDMFTVHVMVLTKLVVDGKIYICESSK